MYTILKAKYEFFCQLSRVTLTRKVHQPRRIGGESSQLLAECMMDYLAFTPNANCSIQTTIPGYNLDTIRRCTHIPKGWPQSPSPCLLVAPYLTPLGYHPILIPISFHLKHHGATSELVRDPNPLPQEMTSSSQTGNLSTSESVFGSFLSPSLLTSVEDQTWKLIFIQLLDPNVCWAQISLGASGQYV